MTGSNRIAAALMSGLLAGSVSSLDYDAIAANAVPTKRVLVPEEKVVIPDTPDSLKPETDEVEVLNKTIPDDALPSLNPVTEDQTNDTIDEPDPIAKPAMQGGLPEVLRDFSALPQPVRRMRELILETAKHGDIEKLRDLIGVGGTATSLSLGGLDGDPIDYLKETSGDNEGFEILAILIEVLEAGFVHVDVGTDSEMFVWPYFFAWPLDKLSPQQMVELFRILTAGDMQDSQEFGAYVFYRVGIRPDGQWNFFVAGD